VVPEFSWRDLQRCAAREVALRNVSPARHTPERELEIAKMEAIAAHFKDLADDQEMAGRDPDAQAFFELNNGGGFYAPLYERKGE
jgi:hypothetical protein